MTAVAVRSCPFLAAIGLLDEQFRSPDQFIFTAVVNLWTLIWADTAATGRLLRRYVAKY